MQYASHEMRPRGRAKLGDEHPQTLTSMGVLQELWYENLVSCGPCCACTKTRRVGSANWIVVSKHAIPFSFGSCGD